MPRVLGEEEAEPRPLAQSWTQKTWIEILPGHLPARWPWTSLLGELGWEVGVSLQILMGPDPCSPCTLGWSFCCLYLSLSSIKWVM